MHMFKPQSCTPQPSPYATGKVWPTSPLLPVATARANTVGQKLFVHKPRKVTD